jgi:DNA-binding CsgD family transcriptional regulator
MSSALQSLFLAIAQARNEQEVRSRIMMDIGAYFQANRWGLFFRDRDPGKITPIKKSLQLALSIEYNPLLRYLVERHAPIHEASLLPPGVWAKICPRFDHGHVMVGPIVDRGYLIGGVGLTRTQADPEFNDRDLSDMGALCLHLSTWWALNKPQGVKTLDSSILTPRELQIAELVARGLTNESISKSLWISENSVKQALKRIFGKLEIASRVELIGKLSASSK